MSGGGGGGGFIPVITFGNDVYELEPGRAGFFLGPECNSATEMFYFKYFI